MIVQVEKLAWNIYSCLSTAPMDDSQQHEDTTLAQLLKRTLAQSEAYLANPPLPAAAALPDHGSNSQHASTSKGVPSLGSLLSNLSLCASLIAHLALLSSNETLSELSTPSLPCLLVPYYTGMLDLQSRTRDYKSRIDALTRAQAQLQMFTDRCDEYEVIPEEKRRELSILASRGLPSDPMSRRDAKIKQYKEEKALKEKLENIEQRRQARAGRPSTSAAEQEDEEDEEIERSLYLTQLSLCYMRAFNELNSIKGEVELLQSMPNMSELPTSPSSSHRTSASDPRQRAREEEDSQWRLDKVTSSLTSPAGHHSQLVDSSGRILRPFTILPSNSSVSNSSNNNIDTRLRLQNEVFGPGYRLPTMSIDEYLQLEGERGNILQGGGPKNTAEVNQEKEDKKAFQEEEDTMEGERRRDEKRVKDLEDDEWKDSHRRGEGNRINMG